MEKNWVDAQEVSEDDQGFINDPLPSEHDTDVLGYGEYVSGEKKKKKKQHRIL